MRRVRCTVDVLSPGAHRVARDVDGDPAGGRLAVAVDERDVQVVALVLLEQGQGRAGHRIAGGGVGADDVADVAAEVDRRRVARDRHRLLAPGRHGHRGRAQREGAAGPGQGQVQRDVLGAVVGEDEVLGHGGVAGLVRPVEVAEEQGPGAADVALDRRRDVDAAGADLERRVPLGQPVGGAHQLLLELLTRPARVLLGEDGGGAGDVGRRHGGAAQRAVHPLPAVGHVLRARRGDVDAGCHQVGLEGSGHRQRAGAGEPGELVLLVDRTHRERRRGRAG